MARVASGLTAADVPAEVTDQAARGFCDCGEMAEKGSVGGFGYAGGGFGPYRICNGCGSVFGKKAAPGGNQLDAGR